MENARRELLTPCGPQLHIKSLHFAQAATAVDGNGFASSLGRLTSSQQGSDSKRLRLLSIVFNILQSESEARADRGIGVIRIDRTQQVSCSHSLFEHVVVDDIASRIGAAPCGIFHLILQ